MNEYLVVYERTANNWSAYVPDLPGCVAAAKTRAETAQLIREAIEFHIEGLRLDGQPVPEPTSEAEKIEVAASPPTSRPSPPQSYPLLPLLRLRPGLMRLSRRPPVRRQFARRARRLVPIAI